MSRMLPSFSKLYLADQCIGSTALPRAEVRGEAAERGTAKHRFLEDVAALGRDEALKRVAPEHRRACEVIDLSKLPDLTSVSSEVGLAYDVQTGAGRVLKLASARDYGEVGPTEIPGAVDVLALVGDDGIFVGDYKSGHARIPPPAENLQLLAGALAACRAHGRSRAVVALIFLGEDGDSRYVDAELDEFALDEAAQRLADIAERVGWARRDVARGKPPRLVVGDHCKFCPSLLACPAQAGLIRRMADPGEVVHEIKGLITPETAAAAYGKAKAFGDALKLAWAALYAYARENPIPLPGGMVWGPVETTRESLDGKVAHEVLTDLHGADIADTAVTLETTKTALEEALSVVATGSGQPLAPLVREALAAIDEAGGVKTKTSESVKEHRPKAPMQLTPPAPLAPAALPVDAPAPRRLAIVDVRPGETEAEATARQA